MSKKRLRANESRYIPLRLNRARCQPLLEKLAGPTHKSWPRVIEEVLESATLQRVAVVPMRDGRMIARIIDEEPADE